MTDTVVGIKSKLATLLSLHLKFPESKNLQQRGIADKIEDACNTIIKEHFDNVVAPRSRKSIEDITIGDVYVDHKTSDQALNFKMPNMISVDTLRKLDHDVVYNFVIYDSIQQVIVKTFALSLYELNWDHLAIQNLGTGQLQIKSMKEFLKSPKSTMTKEEWRARLQKEVTAFYDKLVEKTIKRKQQWQQWN
jgi:hypothetical protein